MPMSNAGMFQLFCPEVHIQIHLHGILLLTIGTVWQAKYIMVIMIYIDPGMCQPSWSGFQLQSILPIVADAQHSQVIAWETCQHLLIRPYLIVNAV